MLYLIEILHQTTTDSADMIRAAALYLIEILHQTTTIRGRIDQLLVVSYRNSTSNHNFAGQASGGERVVSYRNSTSNHN